jgi:hypothetical protein
MKTTQDKPYLATGNFTIFSIMQHVVVVVVVVIVLVVGAYQHCSHEGLLYSNPPVEFRHSSPEALHTKRHERPLLAKDGTKAEKFSYQSVIHEITRFFYMPQSWDMGHIFYFRSEGRHA